VKYFTSFLLLFLSSHCFATHINISGYLKNFFIVQESLNNDIFQLDTLYQSQNSARLMLDGFSDQMTWQIHYEPSIEFRSAASPQFARKSNNYRLADIKNNESNVNKTIVFHNLDRLNVQLQLKAGDLTIGRQAITFGSARIINPSDVFLPFNFRVRNTEYRTGIDAIRFQKPLGELSELDMGIVLSKDAKIENSAVFVQWLGNLSGNDIQVTAMQFSKQKLLGLGYQGALGAIGTWLEVAYVKGNADYYRLSLGFDYAFTENTFFMLEYHNNGAGASNPSGYTDLQNDKAYQDGGVFLLGTNYLLSSLNWQISALLNLGFQGIVNLDDKSLFLNAALNYSLSENLYLGLAYYHFTGDDFLNALEGLQFGSEYGGNPNSISIDLSFYF